MMVIIFPFMGFSRFLSLVGIFIFSLMYWSGLRRYPCTQKFVNFLLTMFGHCNRGEDFMLLNLFFLLFVFLITFTLKHSLIFKISLFVHFENSIRKFLVFLIGYTVLNVFSCLDTLYQDMVLFEFFSQLVEFFNQSFLICLFSCFHFFLVRRLGSESNCIVIVIYTGYGIL